MGPPIIAPAAIQHSLLDCVTHRTYMAVCTFHAKTLQPTRAQSRSVGISRLYVK
jgi:hypothetical protein